MDLILFSFECGTTNSAIAKNRKAVARRILRRRGMLLGVWAVFVPLVIASVEVVFMLMLPPLFSCRPRNWVF
jgi:hypothetical protein